MTARKVPNKGAAKKPSPTVIPPEQVLPPPPDQSPMVLPDQPVNAQVIPIGNPIMADAIEKVQAILRGQGAASNAALLLGQEKIRSAQLDEALGIAVNAMSALVAEQATPE